MSKDPDELRVESSPMIEELERIRLSNLARLQEDMDGRVAARLRLDNYRTHMFYVREMYEAHHIELKPMSFRAEESQAMDLPTPERPGTSTNFGRLEGHE